MSRVRINLGANHDLEGPVHTVVLLNYKMMMTVLLLRGGKCDDGTRFDTGALQVHKCVA